MENSTTTSASKSGWFLILFCENLETNDIYASSGEEGQTEYKPMKMPAGIYKLYLSLESLPDEGEKDKKSGWRISMTSDDKAAGNRPYFFKKSVNKYVINFAGEEDKHEGTKTYALEDGVSQKMYPQSTPSKITASFTCVGHTNFKKIVMELKYWVHFQE